MEHYQHMNLLFSATFTGQINKPCIVVYFNNLNEKHGRQLFLIVYTLKFGAGKKILMFHQVSNLTVK